MRRRRLLAVAFVLASGGTALALEVWPQSPSAQSNPGIPVNANGRVVFSLRNTTSTATTVDSFVGSGSGCLEISSPVPLDPSILTPWTIPPDQQMQFTAETAGFASTGDRSCFWTVSTTPSGNGASVGTTFHVVASEDIDAQPTSINFGVQPKFDSEQQTLVITGWQTGAANVLAEISSNPQGQFAFVGCSTPDSCTISLPGGGGIGSAIVQCTASGTGSDTGLITVLSTDGITTHATVELHCAVAAGSGSGIVLNPMMLMQSAPIGMTDVDAIDASGTGGITGVSISSNLGTLTLQECGGLPSCPFAAVLPTTLHVVCSPMSSTDTGTLTVTGTFGNASAALQCAPSIGSPLLYVSKNAVPFDDTNVFAEDSDTFQIENQGSGSLMNVTLSLGTGGGDFAFSDCDESMPCTVTAGIPKEITVYFRPQSHDYKDAQLTVTAVGSGGSGGGSGQTETVLLSGTAYGGLMVVARPMASESYHLDLGTLPLNQVGSAQIEVRNDGNAAITTMISGAMAPYTLLTDTDVIAGGGSSSTFEVRCSSATPSPANEQTWIVSSSAYAGSPQNVTVSCAIANTNVIVDPLAFDFGEVRTGTPAQSKPLTVTNPAPDSAEITSMKLRAPRTGLSLTPPDTMTTLAMGAAASAALRLETAEDSDLSGEFVDIEVGSATLSLPVRGKVVTAHSRIAPAKLDLGTACVGSPPNGTVRLFNDGTATLAVDAPEMAGASFEAEVPGVTFPAALVPGMDITADVAAATSTAAGKLTSTLTWRDDVPSTYEVPVTLEYVTTGTALSPGGLDYGSVAVDALDTSQSVTLENCDSTPAKVTIKSIRGIKGPIGAWILEPHVGFTKMLASRERQAILVTFAPPARGHYEAELVVETGAGQQKILLAGDATGRDFGNTSFYSCACSGPGAPWGGWPAAFAVVIVISGRRRRGPSSSR